MPRTTGRGRLKQLACEECGRAFETRGPVTRFCTNRCSTAFTGRARRSAKGDVCCARCGRTFIGQTKDWENKPRRRYCSSRCYGLSIRVGGDTYTCEHCGAVNPVRRLKGGGYWYGQRFCSKKCAADAQRTGFIDQHGYRVFTFNHRQIGEHRLVMEKEIGRPLLPNETVHHRDGDRLNNDPANLEVWVSRHGKGQRLVDVLRWASDLLERHGYTVTPPASAGS